MQEEHSVALPALLCEILRAAFHATTEPARPSGKGSEIQSKNIQWLIPPFLRITRLAKRLNISYVVGSAPRKGYDVIPCDILRNATAHTATSTPCQQIKPLFPCMVTADLARRPLPSFVFPAIFTLALTRRRILGLRLGLTASGTITNWVVPSWLAVGSELPAASGAHVFSNCPPLQLGFAFP